MRFDPPYNFLRKAYVPTGRHLPFLSRFTLVGTVRTHHDRIVPSRTFFARIIFTKHYPRLVYCGIATLKMADKQLKLYVDEDLITQLKAAAKRYGKSSHNMIAVEIIERYFPFWEELQQSQERIFEEQRERSGISKPHPRPDRPRGGLTYPPKLFSPANL